MAKRRLNAKQYGQLLFAENRSFLKNLQIAKKTSPVALISAAALAAFRLFPLISRANLEKKEPLFLEKILKEYERLLKKRYLGEDVALVQTAVPLTIEEEDELNDRLAKIFGRYLKLEIEVNPELIGGIVIKVGDKIIDRSILGKLKKLETHIIK